jgi:hypothetical protein
MFGRALTHGTERPTLAARFTGGTMNARLRITARLVVVALAGIAQPAPAVTPGGLAAGHAYTSGTATQFAVDITVAVDPGITSYFWAQQFWLATAVDHGGYFGIQGNGSTTGIGAVGKMFIFSIWNATSAVADDGATAQSFGGEGIGYSIHRTISWNRNVAYRFELTKIGTTGWHAVVHSPDGDIGLGTIYVAEDTTLQPNFANFTEYYGDLPACGDLPPAQVLFSNMVYGSTSISFNDASPYGTCVAMATTSISNAHVNVHSIAGADHVFGNGFDL